jgi:hypothetical protein
VSFELQFTQTATATLDALRSAAESALEGRTGQRKTKAGGGKRKTKASKQEGLFKQVAKTLQLLAADPRHQSLSTHEYDSIENPVRSGEKAFEAYVQNNTPGAYRVFWCYGPAQEEITIIAITPHP